MGSKQVTVTGTLGTSKTFKGCPTLTQNRYYTPGDGPLYRWKAPARGNKRTVTMPTGSVHPLVRLVFGEMARQARRYGDLESASGVRTASVKGWRKKNAPGLATMTAMLNVLGIDLIPVPAPEVIPTEIAPDLAALSGKLEKSMPETWAAVVSFAASQQLAREAAAQTLAKIDAVRPLN